MKKLFFIAIAMPLSLWARLGGAWIDPAPSGTPYATNLVAFAENLLEALPCDGREFSAISNKVDKIISAQSDGFFRDRFALLMAADYIGMLAGFSLDAEISQEQRREAASCDGLMRRTGLIPMQNIGINCMFNRYAAPHRYMQIMYSGKIARWNKSLAEYRAWVLQRFAPYVLAEMQRIKTPDERLVFMEGFSLRARLSDDEKAQIFTQVETL